MSSNMIVKRVCEWCRKPFEAKTTSTRFCSKYCNGKAYEAAQRRDIVQSCDNGGESSTVTRWAEINAKMILTVDDAAFMLTTSRQTIYTMIDSERLRAFSLTKKNYRILKADIFEMFTGGYNNEALKDKPMHTPVHLRRKDAYTINEVLAKYNISASNLQKVLKQNGVAKEKFGRGLMVSKGIVDGILKNYQIREIRDVRPAIPLVREECYLIHEIYEKYNIKSGRLYQILLKNRVPKQRCGKGVIVNKKVVDELLKDICPVNG